MTGCRSEICDAELDDFAGWTEENDEWIDAVLTAAGYVGLVLGVVALCFPPTSWLAMILIASMIRRVAGGTPW